MPAFPSLLGKGGREPCGNSRERADGSRGTESPTALATADHRQRSSPRALLAKAGGSHLNISCQTQTKRIRHIGFPLSRCLSVWDASKNAHGDTSFFQESPALISAPDSPQRGYLFYQHKSKRPRQAWLSHHMSLHIGGHMSQGDTVSCHLPGSHRAHQTSFCKTLQQQATEDFLYEPRWPPQRMRARWNLASSNWRWQRRKQPSKKISG